MSSESTEPPQVIAEVLAGDALSLVEAARLVPAFRPGKPTHAATVWRWAARGIRLPDGQLVRLETCRIGGRQLTSRAALGRFIGAQTPSADTEMGPIPAPPTPTKRTRISTRASQELDRLGL
jgi:Protein of unknown function (DUF1580)